MANLHLNSLGGKSQNSGQGFRDSSLLSQSVFSTFSLHSLLDLILVGFCSLLSGQIYAKTSPFKYPEKYLLSLKKMIIEKRMKGFQLCVLCSEANNTRSNLNPSNSSATWHSQFLSDAAGLGECSFGLKTDRI